MSLESIDKLRELSLCSQASKRRLAMELLSTFEVSEQIPLIFELLRSPHKDLCEAVLAFCQDESISMHPTWISSLQGQLATTRFEDATRHNYPQYLLVLAGRLQPSHLDLFRDKFFEALESQNPDLQYQALVALENLEESSEDYAKALIKFLEHSDSDVRIVASQGLVRLNYTSSLESLQEASRYATSQDSFHFILARCALGEKTLEPQLLQALYNPQWCYPAILALAHYGTSSAIPELLRFAKSWMKEPTLRVSAAESAATLGSEEAISLLRKFAKQSKGNPELAKLALQKLGHSVE